MTLEMILGSLTALGALVSLIFGGGILSRHIKHSNELAVTKYILEETQKKLAAVIDDVADLKNNSVEVNTKIQQFTEHIKKLDLIPQLDAKMNAMEKLVENVQSMVTVIVNKSRSH